MFIVVFDCYLMVNKVEYKTLQTFVLVIAKDGLDTGIWQCRSCLNVRL